MAITRKYNNQILICLDAILELQKALISKILTNKHLIRQFALSKNNLDDNTLNYVLTGDGPSNLVFQTHKAIISKLIYSTFFREKKVPISWLSKNFYCFKREQTDNLYIDINVSNITSGLTKAEVINVLEEAHLNYLKSRFFYKNGNLEIKKSKIHLQDKGAIYTTREITKKITRTTISNLLKSGVPKEELRILDFGCGSGRFYLEALKYLTSNLGMNRRAVIKNNLFGVDIDPIALDILKITVYASGNPKSLSDLEVLSNNLVNKNILIPLKPSTSNSSQTRETNNFLEVINARGFNVIISNPPYFLLKINQKSCHDEFISSFYRELNEKIIAELNFFRNSGTYRYATEGMLNYYKLSIEMMLNISSTNAEFGIICPSTLFTDLSSKKLRKFLLLKNKIHEICYYPESAKLFEDVSQSTVIFYLKKGLLTDKIKITLSGKNLEVPFSLIKQTFSENYEVPYIDKIGWNILKKLSNFKKLKEIDYIKNKRGELDLTLNKKYITNKDTGWKLVRGNMISDNGLKEKNKEYVLVDEFLNEKNGRLIKEGFNKKRLVCQQVSNIDTKKRLKFVFVEKKYILANSCNYLFTENKEILPFLKDLLNSYLLNWRFKIVSGNNHINNYELDELPIIISNMELKNEDSLTKNIIINKLFNLNKEESKYILNGFFEITKIDEKWSQVR